MYTNKIRSKFVSVAVFICFMFVVLSIGQISFAAGDEDTIGGAQGSFGTSDPNAETINNAIRGATFKPSESTACTKPIDFPTLFAYAECVLTKYVIPFLFALAIVVFLTGVVKYVAGGDNEEKRAQGRNIMWFGIIALFVMVGVWGFVKILVVSFGFEYKLPSLPPKSNSVFGG